MTSQWRTVSLARKRIGWHRWSGQRVRRARQARQDRRVRRGPMGRRERPALPGRQARLGLMAQHPELKCVASLMGSGYFTSLSHTLFPPSAATPLERERLLAPLAKWDIGHQLARLADRPLLQIPRIEHVSRGWTRR